jgi:transposase-like protein
MSTPETIHIYFSSEEAARLHIEKVRWNGAPVCPKCQNSKKQYRQNRKDVAGYYICGACGKVYTVRAGTIFSRSQVPLNKWLFAIHYVLTARNGISSSWLSKKLGVSKKTSWLMILRIRQALENDSGSGFLKGLAEFDEASI